MKQLFKFERFAQIAVEGEENVPKQVTDRFYNIDSEQFVYRLSDGNTYNIHDVHTFYKEIIE